MQLVNSVLSSIPVYYMNCFRLPKWVIKRMDKVRRLFLWGKGEQGGRRISLLNWESVCILKKWGGMGVRNFETQNISLLLCWSWRLYQHDTSLWAFWARKLRASITNENRPAK